MAIYGKVKLVFDIEQDKVVNLEGKSISPLVQSIIVPAKTKSIIVDITNLNDWRQFWTQYGTFNLEIITPEVQNKIYPLHLSLPHATKKTTCCGGREVPVKEYFNIYWEITQINQF
jgi:hypothetical protein